MAFKLHDRPDALNFHSFPGDQSMVGLSQGYDFIRTGSRRSNPVYSCIPSWPVKVLRSPSPPPFSPWLFLYWYSVIPAFYFYLVSLGFSYHSVPLTLCLISLILNSKALFLTTNWKARGSSFQCKPKFIIFLTKSHFLFLFCLVQWHYYPSTWQKPESNLIFYYPCTIPQWLVTVALILQVSPVPTLFFPILLVLS